MVEPFLTPAPPAAWSVSALLLAVADQLAARFDGVTVRGELSGFSRAASGHCYFSLKDADGAPGLLRCAMFRRAAQLLDFQPAEGQRVELRGRLSLYEPRGELQIVVESLQRQGAGSLYEEFLRLRARLAAQGLFDESRRRPLPRHPRTVGVITSPDAAAWRDVMTAMARRAPQVRVILYPSRVQGAQAPGELVAALVTAAQRQEADLLLLVRGGGSLEDLWSFNDERVVRAVAASPIPVICGVGHETDVTLCDLAADLRAATPTAAAELAAPALDALLAEHRLIQQRWSRGLRQAIERPSQTLDLLAQRIGKPLARLAVETQRQRGLAQRIASAAHRQTGRLAEAAGPLQRRLARAWQTEAERRLRALQVLQARMQAAHPQHVLARGFAWVTDAQGRPLLSARALKVGQEVDAVFADGRARTRVLGIQPADPPVSADGQSVLAPLHKGSPD